jgi:predicted kinase
MAQEQEFILTRGLPGSGKSTWAKQWVTQAPGRVRVNRDDIREELFGKEYHGNQKKEAEEKVTQVEHTRIIRALKEGKSVVSDNMHVNPRFLKAFYRMADQAGVKLGHRDFPITIEEAIRRNHNRDRQVPDDIIRKIAREHLGPNGEFHYFDGDYTPRPFVAPAVPGQMALGFDLDGSLSDTRNITHFVKRPKHRDFDSFHRHSFFTPANPEVLQILKDAQDNGFAILITTARSEKYREVSEQWLNNLGITPDNMFMRPNDDMRPDYEVKNDMYNEKIKPHYDLVRMVDDNIQAIDAWKKNGIAVTEVPGFTKEIPVDQVIHVNNVFSSGGCIRCGRPLKNGGLIGPNCARMA